jgi:hypothetical protein
MRSLGSRPADTPAWDAEYPSQVRYEAELRYEGANLEGIAPSMPRFAAASHGSDRALPSSRKERGSLYGGIWDSRARSRSRSAA